MTAKVTDNLNIKTKKNTFRCRDIKRPAFEGVMFYCDYSDSGPRGR